MFKVMRDSPSIPEVLSPEGKDFLRCCFRRNPAERPSATMLLEHRWFKNSQQLDVSSTIQSISGIKLTVSYQCHSHSLCFFFLFLLFSLSKWIVVIWIIYHINWQDISQSLRASEVKFDHLPGLPSSRSTKGKTTADR